MFVLVQILLHDQKSIPQMDEQGFAAAPGSHTLVGIKTKQVRTIFISLREKKNVYKREKNQYADSYWQNNWRIYILLEKEWF